MEQQNREKLSDKAFARLAITSILGILVCIICLCSSTFAWFTDSAPSSGNEIKTADGCGLSVTVTLNGVAIEDIESGVELAASDDPYVVTLSLPAGTASGYCLITVGGNTYYTDYILRHEDPVVHTITFELVVETTQTVTFTPRWGIHTKDCDVADNGELILP